MAIGKIPNLGGGSGGGDFGGWPDDLPLPKEDPSLSMDPGGEPEGDQEYHGKIRADLIIANDDREQREAQGDGGDREALPDLGGPDGGGEQEFSMPDFDFQKTEGSPEDLNDMARNRGKVAGSVEAQNPEPGDNAPAGVALESEDHNLPPRPEIDLSLGDHEAPDEPAKTPYLPWAYPLPTDQGDDPPAPQFEAPEPDEVQLHPFDKPQDQEPLNASLPGAPQDQEPVIPPQYNAPPPAPVEIGQNEDLFARTGWPVSPPRTVSTHWYM